MTHQDGQVAGSCEHGNEHLGSMKCGHFLDYLWRHSMFKDLAAWSSLYTINIIII